MITRDCIFVRFVFLFILFYLFFLVVNYWVGLEKGEMVLLQGPVICPVVLAKQAGVYALPVNGPLVKARLLRNELWGCKGVVSGYKTQVGVISRQLIARKCNRVRCSLSSSSNGNGSTAENFNESDEDYVNSSVVEAGMLTMVANSCFCFKIP